MRETPMMRSIRNGTEAQLLAFRKQLNEQIAKRKEATCRSYLFLEIITLLFCCIMMPAFPNTPAKFAAMSVSQLLCWIFWLIVYRPRFRDAKIMETILITLVNDALQAKQHAE